MMFNQGEYFVYDVAIVGAGPAGATLARLLAGRFNVLLLEKRLMQETIEVGADKCCGGLVAPDAQRMLARLGLGIPRSVLVGPQLFVVRTIDLPQKLERYYQRNYINIDRGRFDRWLFSLVPSTVHKQDQTLLQKVSRDTSGCFTLHLRGANAHRTVRARAIIGADGANSQVRKMLFPHNREYRTYIAIQEWFAAVNPLPYYSAIFDSRCTDFYGWTIPKENKLIFGAALPGTGPAVQASFTSIKKQLIAYGYDFSTHLRRHGTLLLRPKKVYPSLYATEQAALIGEAGGWISPSSAEGLSWALESAWLLAQSMHDGLTGFAERYLDLTAGMRRRIKAKHWKSFVMYMPSLRWLALKSNVRTIHVCADNTNDT
jgi:geranylgeranyl reductase